jgi:hypothetical protein
MLQFNNRWRFDSPGPIEGGVASGFLDLINRVCGQGNCGARPALFGGGKPG